MNAAGPGFSKRTGIHYKIMDWKSGKSLPSDRGDLDRAVRAAATASEQDAEAAEALVAKFGELLRQAKEQRGYHRGNRKDGFRPAKEAFRDEFAKLVDAARPGYAKGTGIRQDLITKWKSGTSSPFRSGELEKVVRAAATASGQTPEELKHW